MTSSGNDPFYNLARAPSIEHRNVRSKSGSLQGNIVAHVIDENWYGKDNIFEDSEALLKACFIVDVQ